MACPCSAAPVLSLDMSSHAPPLSKLSCGINHDQLTMTQPANRLTKQSTNTGVGDDNVANTDYADVDKYDYDDACGDAVDYNSYDDADDNADDYFDAAGVGLVVSEALQGQVLSGSSDGVGLGIPYIEGGVLSVALDG